jgi:hypothetical protein
MRATIAAAGKAFNADEPGACYRSATTDTSEAKMQARKTPIILSGRMLQAYEAKLRRHRRNMRGVRRALAS